ncbi:flagellar basal body P-ring formation chaperone FlgA [Azohydromonas caseinilytica]|uniref:Flagella basal body P-ring formation protein FlgA n=1 Tax=Azohydromonas caseinilytica TaxID=2728836 RepID=A0A848F685_9BURK|nr:flagellar basal body P-ring formation chaperone FlgA [Azohydromonas caseinilytica]NML14902.1 flagellar basal body P-ring formation protein FlgA [Azohydromonas caseinilytica]
MLRPLLLVAFGLSAAAGAWAQVPAPATASVLDPALLERVRGLAQQGAQAGAAEVPGARVVVELGTLDPRLRLAPCAQVQPYLPNGQRMWGRARIGLRCTQGAAWNVFLPVSVKVFMPSLVLTQSLPAGTLLDATHLGSEEVDVAAGSSPAVTRAEQALGRTLTRAMGAGDALRRADLRARQWFAAGDTVRVVAQGDGYSVSGEAQAMGPGLEGQAVRLRTDSGRIVSAMPVAPRQAEVTP